MSEIPMLEIFKEGGAIGLAALVMLIGLWDRRTMNDERRMNNLTLNNHLDHLNATLTMHDANQEKLVDAIDRQNRILERVERILDK